MDANVRNSILSLTHFAQTIQHDFSLIKRYSQNKGATSQKLETGRADKILNALATLLSRGTETETNHAVSVLASPRVQSNLGVVVAKCVANYPPMVRILRYSCLVRQRLRTPLRNDLDESYPQGSSC
jgi:hypothetical protein